MKKLFLIACLCSTSLINVSTSFANTVYTVQKRSPLSFVYGDGTYTYNIFFDSNSTSLDNVTMEGGFTVLAFLNTDITYDSSTGRYTVKGFKVRFTDGSTTSEVRIANMELQDL
ncbi:hypothetical protein [Pedobacter borealis]|uniref:hypothetical protein n=1 Tax=Pedobacter borealis TaxID=475254 RepID=UPI0004933BAA|nr:hypothetical protein [Pedobacter borealis]